MITEDYHTIILTFDEVDLMIYQPWRFDIQRGERPSLDVKCPGLINHDVN